MLPRATVVGSCLAIALTLVATPAARATWGQEGYSASARFSNPVDSALGPHNVASVQRDWQLTLSPGGETQLIPQEVVVGDDRAVAVVETAPHFLGGHLEVVAVRPSSGEKLWSSAPLPEAAGQASSKPVLFGTRVWLAWAGRLLTYPTRCSDPCTPRVFTTRAGYRRPGPHDRFGARRGPGGRSGAPAGLRPLVHV